MSGVLRLIRPERASAQHRLNNVAVVAAFHGGEQRLIVLRGGFNPAKQIQRQLTQEGTQVLELLGARASCTRNSAGCSSASSLRGGHIGNQHALLDQLVGIIALHGFDRSDLALFIKQDRVSCVSKSSAPRDPARSVVKPIEPFDLLTALGSTWGLQPSSITAPTSV